jgi:small-conductance mechanosensitive channel
MRERIRPCVHALLGGLLLFGCASDAPRALPIAPAPTAPAASSLSGRESDEWRALINRGLTYLAVSEASIDSLERELPADVQALRKRLLGIEVRARRLRVLFRARRKTPTFLFNIEQQIRVLDFAVKESMAPIEKMDRDLSAMEQFGDPGGGGKTRVGEDGTVVTLLPGDIASMIAGFRARNGALRVRAQSLRERLGPSLSYGRAFQTELEEFKAAAGGETVVVMRGFYGAPARRLLSPAAWRKAYASLAVWIANFTSIDLAFDQYDNWIWLQVLIRTSIAALILVVGARFVVGRLQRRMRVAGLSRALFPPAVWLACGAGLSFGIGVPYFVCSAFVVIVVWLFLSRSLISLGVRLRSIFGPAPSGRGDEGLTLLWVCAAAGNVLQSLDMRTETVAVLWAAVLLILWRVLCAGRRGGAPDEDAARRFLLGFIPALAAAAVLGWANLAIFSSTIVMMVGVGIVLAEGVAVSRRYFDERAGSSRRALSIMLAREVISPANVFIAALYAGLAGYAVYLAGRPLLRFIFDMKISYRNITVHMVSVPLIIAGYFAARTLVLIAADLITALRGDGAAATEGEIVSLQVLSRYMIWFIFLMIALSLLGFTIGNLAIVAGGLSVGIGFGMQQIINNLVSGLILLLGREIQPGDMIERDGNFARVERVTLRNTYLHTYAGKAIIVPNSEFVNKSFSNWTYRDPRIRGHISVKVPASVESRAVEEILLRVAKAHPSVLKFPVPSVRLEGIGQAGLEFALRVWVAHPRDWKVISDLRHEVFRALREKGIAPV